MWAPPDKPLQRVNPANATANPVSDWLPVCRRSKSPDPMSYREYSFATLVRVILSRVSAE